MERAGTVGGDKRIAKRYADRKEDETLYIKRFRQSPGGRTVTFIALAHNARETRSDGKSQTRPYLVVSLGNEADADPRYVQDLLMMAETLYERRISEGMKPVEAIDAVRRVLKPMVSGIQHQDDTILARFGIEALPHLWTTWREVPRQDKPAPSKALRLTGAS